MEIARLVLIPVQDGMGPKDLANIVGEQVGIFLGGSRLRWPARQIPPRTCAPSLSWPIGAG
jgi:hypothetical protein